MATILSVKEQTYQIIKEKILNQEYPAGARININELAEELGISNSPIREHSVAGATGPGHIESQQRGDGDDLYPTETSMNFRRCICFGLSKAIDFVVKPTSWKS